MNKHHNTIVSALLALTGVCWSAGPAMAQVAGGSTTVDVNVTESTQVAMGWSVRKTLLGRNIYNETGQTIGKVEDLIIAPDRNLSYVIIGAGGFIGIGRHDVAVPVNQIQDQAGKLVMSGATRETMKALPAFYYATGSSRRGEFVVAAEKEIARGKSRLDDLGKMAGAATADGKARLDVQIAGLQVDVKSVEARLAELKQATANRWKELEASVAAATARLHKSLETTSS